MVSSESLRIVFFGTPEFAVPTLDTLLRTRHSVVGVVTQPDRARGRGHKVSDAPVKQRAVAAGLPLLQPERLKDPPFLEALGGFDPDLGVVVAYGKILTEAVLAVPRLGLVNVHASLLPRYRGAAPVHRAVIAGETETGVTIMRMDWTWPAERLHNLVRGLHPWPHAFTFVHEQRLILHRSSVFDGGDARLDGSRDAVAAEPGTILEAHGDLLLVRAGTGVLRLVELQAEDKRPMTVREFLAGHPFRAGDRFTGAPRIE